MSFGSSSTLPSDVYIKEETSCEDHDAAALRVRESQIKLEPSDMQNNLEPGNQEVELEFVKVEPYCEDYSDGPTGGAAAERSDMQLAQERVRLEDSLYPGHVVKCELFEPEVRQQPAPSTPQTCKEGTEALEATSHWHCNHSGTTLSCDNCKKTPPPSMNMDCKKTIKARKVTLKQVTCNTCDRTFSSMSTLNRHQRIHTGEKPFACVICDKKFAKKEALTTHLRVHSGERPFTCDICNKTFAQKSNLTKHQHVHSFMKTFTCNICNKKFSQKSNLTRHLHVHTLEKTFVCDICNKMFAERGTLTVHRRVHSGEKPFKCDNCYKKFSLKCNLTTHLRVHSGEKPYICHICDKKFSFKCNLTIHLRVHSGEKPFACNVCENKFTQRSQLITHLRVHSAAVVKDIYSQGC